MILHSRFLSWSREKRKFDSHSKFLSILILSVSFFLFFCFFFLLSFLFVCLSVVAFFIITVIIFARAKYASGFEFSRFSFRGSAARPKSSYIHCGVVRARSSVLNSVYNFHF